MSFLSASIIFFPCVLLFPPPPHRIVFLVCSRSPSFLFPNSIASNRSHPWQRLICKLLPRFGAYPLANFPTLAPGLASSNFLPASPSWNAGKSAQSTSIPGSGISEPFPPKMIIWGRIR